MGSIGGQINTRAVGLSQIKRTQTKKTAEQLKRGFPKTGSEKSLKEFCTANGIKDQTKFSFKPLVKTLAQTLSILGNGLIAPYN